MIANDTEISQRRYTVSLAEFVASSNLSSSYIRQERFLMMFWENWDDPPYVAMKNTREFCEKLIAQFLYIKENEKLTSNEPSAQLGIESVGRTSSVSRSSHLTLKTLWEGIELCIFKTLSLAPTRANYVWDLCCSRLSVERKAKKDLSEFAMSEALY